VKVNCCNINSINKIWIGISTMLDKPFPLLPGQALVGLGKRVALARRARQLNQRDLAFLAGVGASSIVALEKGHPGVAMGTLVRVLDALGLLAETDQLLIAQRDPALVQHAVRALQK
jgi:DNA-binding XRE family transcriptional regulator